TLLTLEDLHWADRSSIDLLTFVGNAARRERLLLVGTYRSDLVGPNQPLWTALLALERLPATVRIDLEPLTRDEVRAQIDALGGPSMAPGELDQLVGRAAGNPFFVEELLATAGRGSLPASIRDVLLDRFNALPDDARRVVRAVAVAGGGATDEMVAAM